MQRRILVTGGGGFVGSRLLARLAASVGPEDRLVSASRELAIESPAGVDFIAVDLADEMLCDRLVRDTRPTHIVHLAAVSSVAEGFGTEGAVWTNNFLPTWRLAEAAQKLETAASFIFASSAEVYGAGFLQFPIAVEDGPTLPLNAYARSKLAGELVLQDMSDKLSGVVALRLFNSIGAGQDERFVVANLAAQVARIESGIVAPVLHVGNTEAERDFVSVDDTVDALTKVLGFASSNPGFHVFNVASGMSHSVGDVIAELAHFANIEFTVEVDEARLRPVEIRRAVGDASRLNQATGWKTARTWKESIKKVLDYWRERTRNGL